MIHSFLLLLLVTRCMGDSPAPPCTESCDSSTETEESKVEREFDRMHSEPMDDLVASIYNMRWGYRYRRLHQSQADWGGLNVAMGKASEGELWRLEDQASMGGGWFVKNAKWGDLLEMHGGMDMGTENGDYNDYQNWIFEPTGQKGAYLLKNWKLDAVACIVQGTQLRGYPLDSRSDDDYVCLARTGAIGAGGSGNVKRISFEECKETFRGTGKGFTYYEGSQHCQETDDSSDAVSNGDWTTCYDVAHSQKQGGESAMFGDTFGDACLWRFENMWKSDALWHTITTVDNDSGSDDKFTYSYTVGYSSEVSSSHSHSVGSSVSMSASGGGAIKGIDLGMEMTTTMTNEFTDSVSSSYSSQQSVTKTHSTKVKAGECITVRQLVIDQTDELKISTDSEFPTLPGFRGTTDTLWIKNCGDAGNGDPTSPGSRAYAEDDKTVVPPASPSTHSASSQSSAAKSTPLHTLDQEYHLKESNTDSVSDKEETWSKKERKEKGEAETEVGLQCGQGEYRECNRGGVCWCMTATASTVTMTTTKSSTPLVVNVFAAVGLSFALYGAFRHYTQK